MIDTRGKSCPEPVIMVSNALKSGESVYEIMADNRVSVENITRFAKKAGYSVAVEPDGDDEFKLVLSK